MDDPAALVAFIGKLAVEAFEHRIQRLLDLEKQRFVIGSHEQGHVAVGADGPHADRLESDVLHGKTIEQPQPVGVEALAIRGEYSLDVETVLGVGLGIKMENGHRLVDDLLTAAGDEVREIIILRQTLPPRLGDHAGELAPQIAVADAFDLLLEIDATVPYLKRRK